MVNTPIRRYRVDDVTYNAAAEKAAGAGVTVSDVIREALERYAAGVAGDAVPDSAAFVVRYRERPAGPRAKVDPWNHSAPLPESDARKMFQQMKRNMAKTLEFQLVRREEFVVG